MSIESESRPIDKCPAVGDRIFVEDKGSMRAAKVDFTEEGQFIEFTFEDDGTSWSLTLPDGLNPLIFTRKAS